MKNVYRMMKDLKLLHWVKEAKELIAADKVLLN
jgi:hypothetical protein